MNEYVILCASRGCGYVYFLEVWYHGPVHYGDLDAIHIGGCCSDGFCMCRLQMKTVRCFILWCQGGHSLCVTLFFLSVACPAVIDMSASVNLVFFPCFFFCHVSLLTWFSIKNT